MNIGVLGGTFNPIHLGHLAMAQIAASTLGLDRVLLMVAADPPHKQVDNGVSPKDRLLMTRLAAQGREGLTACDLELERPGKSYTSDTLLTLREMDDAADLYLILGSDMLSDLPGWHRPDLVLSAATVACVPRTGQTERDQGAAEALRQTFGAKVIFLPEGAPPISSTQVRDRLEAGLPVADLLPPAVERYCYETGLYFPPAVRAVQEKLRAVLPEKRFRHTMGVVRTAAELAARWGADPQKARLAALLHDCAKYLPEEELLALSGDTSPVSSVWHAFAGPAVASRDYGVTDPAVLRAIRLHATGEENMTLLEEITYLADLIEPNRNFPCVAECRDAVGDDPEAAMLYALKRTRGYVEKNGGLFHPASARAIDYFEKRNPPPQK